MHGEFLAPLPQTVDMITLPGHPLLDKTALIGGCALCRVDAERLRGGRLGRSGCHAVVGSVCTTLPRRFSCATRACRATADRGSRGIAACFLRGSDAAVRARSAVCSLAARRGHRGLPTKPTISQDDSHPLPVTTHARHGCAPTQLSHATRRSLGAEQLHGARRVPIRAFAHASDCDFPRICRFARARGTRPRHGRSGGLRSPISESTIA